MLLFSTEFTWATGDFFPLVLLLLFRAGDKSGDLYLRRRNGGGGEGGVFGERKKIIRRIVFTPRRI